MLEVLSVSTDASSKALDEIQSNLDWQKSEAAVEIYAWFSKDSIPTTTLEPSTTSEITSTEDSSTEPTTLAGSTIILSTVLGLSCAAMRLLL